MIMRKNTKALGRKRLGVFQVLFQYLFGGVRKCGAQLSALEYDQ